MGVLGPARRDDEAMDDVDAGRGVGAEGAEGAVGAEGAGGAGDADAEGADAEGGVLVGEGREGAEGEGAAEGDVRVGVVEDAEGAVGEGAGAVVGAGAVGAAGVAGGAEDAEDAAAGAEGEAGEDTGVVAAAGEGAAGGAAGAAGVVGACRVDMGSAGRGEREGTGAVPEAERAGAVEGGEDRGGDIAHRRSCRLSASFCSVSAKTGKRSAPWSAASKKYKTLSS